MLSGMLAKWLRAAPVKLIVRIWLKTWREAELSEKHGCTHKQKLPHREIWELVSFLGGSFENIPISFWIRWFQALIHSLSCASARTWSTWPSGLHPVSPGSSGKWALKDHRPALFSWYFWYQKILLNVKKTLKLNFYDDQAGPGWSLWRDLVISSLVTKHGWDWGWKLFW